MEPFEIQPDAFVEKQKEVIAQLTNENILLTCRVEQLEQANRELAVSISEPMAADPDDRVEQNRTERANELISNMKGRADEWEEEQEAAERAKDDFPQMNMPSFMERMGVTEAAEPHQRSWDVT